MHELLKRLCFISCAKSTSVGVVDFLLKEGQVDILSPEGLMRSGDRHPLSLCIYIL